MAVTKLMNIKSTPHGAGRHLYNSIRYILNPDKTKDGLLVGGNSGNEAREVFDTMMNTKREWDKLDGRQGYHFVLSWKPGEADPEKAYQVIQEFCDKYLGDHYDYVFSVHDDQEHIHGHIVFNSVSRTTGYKYRYEKGDWEKYIQPVTDEICARHGLSKLEYDKGQTIGKSYAEHYAEKEGRYTWKKIIQADIDYMVSCSESWQDFLDQMKQIGYTFPRSGVKRGIGEYITFCAPGGHKRRSDSLGSGYSVAEIKARIAKNMPGKQKESKKSYLSSPWVKSWRMDFYKMKNAMTPYHAKYVKRYLRVSIYASRNNPYAVGWSEVRKDLLQIDRLKQDCRYLLSHSICSEQELDQRADKLKKEEKYLKERRSEMDLVCEDEAVIQYLELEKKLSDIKKPDDDSFEEVQDQIEAIEKALPHGTKQLILESHKAEGRLNEIRTEKKIIRHIRKNITQPELKVSKMIKKKTAKRISTRGRGKEGVKQWKQK